MISEAGCFLFLFFSMLQMLKGTKSSILAMPERQRLTDEQLLRVIVQQEVVCIRISSQKMWLSRQKIFDVVNIS